MHKDLQNLLEVLRKRRNFQAELCSQAKIQLLNSYMTETGLSGIVVGVSGGIDSALALSLVVKASKQPGSPIKRIIAALLPYLDIKEGTTNQETATKLGKEVAESIGCEWVCVDLTSTHQELKITTDKALKIPGNIWAAGQLVSYLRTPALYYITALLSQEGHPAVLVGTTNRDEGGYIGYFGKAADGMNDLQIISDLHKSEVYELSRYLENIPKSVFLSPPSGDIYDGRTDEQLIGLDYDSIELYTLFLCENDNLKEIYLKCISEEGQLEWNNISNRIEQLHRENLHKYIGGSPSLHFDIYRRDVPGGWKPQNDVLKLHNNCNPFLFSQFNAKEIIYSDIIKSKSTNNIQAVHLDDFGESILIINNSFSDYECLLFKSELNSILTNNQNLQNHFLSDLIWFRISHLLPPIRFCDEFTPVLSDGHPIWRPIGLIPSFQIRRNNSLNLLPLTFPKNDKNTFKLNRTTKTLMHFFLFLDIEELTINLLQDLERYKPIEERISTKVLPIEERIPIEGIPIEERISERRTQTEVIISLDRINCKEGQIILIDHKLPFRIEFTNYNNTEQNKYYLFLQSEVVFEQCGLPQFQQIHQSKPLGIISKTNDTTPTTSGVNKIEENEKTLIEKIEKDPYYSLLYQRTRNLSEVILGGFFDDGSPSPSQIPDWKPQWEFSSPFWRITPTHKIEKRLSNGPKIPENKWLCVLLITGCFCPIHNGHLSLLELAREAVEENGGEVIGGYISPSHDNYINLKLGSEGLSARQRIHLCELATVNSNWIEVDPWESLNLNYAVNFTDVILRLSQYLSYNIRTNRPIQVVYAFGSDNAKFSLAFVNKGRAVCVSRPGASNQLTTFKDRKEFKNNNRVIFWNSQSHDVSSTSIRKGEKRELIPTNVLSLFQEWISKTNLARDSVLYKMRDEGKWNFEHWINDNTNINSLLEHWNVFQKDICSALSKSHSHQSPDQSADHQSHRSYIQIEILDLMKQKEYFEDMLKKKSKKVIILDPCLSTSIPHPSLFPLQVSRLFNLSSALCQNSILTNRPQSPPLKDQLDLIPNGEYILFDDDISTGTTLREVQDLILREKSDIKITEITTLNSSQGKTEILDLRDFLIGSREGGLVVSCQNQLLRAPYCLPYVRPSSRASIPFTSELYFSRCVWEANVKFFSNFCGGSYPLLSDAPKPFQTLMLLHGFQPNQTLKEIANWHLKELNKLNIEFN